MTEDNNAILHASLLRGSLSVKVSAIDIRRDGDPVGIDDDTSSTERSGASTGRISLPNIGLPSLVSIETDYIITIDSTNRVKFDEATERKLSDTSRLVDKLEKFQCSKRYVDVRNFASTLRDYAEELVYHYEDAQASSKKDAKSSSGNTKKTSYLFRGVEKMLSKPVEAMQFVTNTETRSSNLVKELDSVFDDKKKSNNPNPKSTNNASGERSGKMSRRTSEHLTQGAPSYVRQILVGVDEFYEMIYSEKRQFGGRKTQYDVVKKTAERRRQIINGAFASLIRGLTSGELKSVENGGPKSLKKLIASLEKFLLTDVVISGTLVKKKGKGVEVETKRPTTTIANDVAKAAASSDPDMDASIVNPLTTRMRASAGDREAEEKVCERVAEFVLPTSSEKKLQVSKDDGTGGGNTAAASVGNHSEGGGEYQVPPIIEVPTGVLPDHPIDFAITVALGAALFKYLENRVMNNVPLDNLAVFGIGCILIGYQLGAMASVAQIQDVASTGTPPPSVSNDATKNDVPSPTSKDESGGNRRASLVVNRRTLLSKSAGSLSLSESQSRYLGLMRKSIRIVKSAVTEEKEEKKKEVPPAPTFDEFPAGAAIGSHLNCWSSPPSGNFHVRGPNYLKDKKKVPSENYLLPTRGCDLFLTDNPPVNLGRNRAILAGRLRDVPTFIINYRLPWGVFLSYHEIPQKFIPFLRRGNGYGDLTTPLPSMADMHPGERALANFLLSDTEEKNQLLKIVPVVVEGPWVVKRVVGGKPAIVGTKMPISYVYQPPQEGGKLAEYLEADLDIVSSAAARNILAVVRSYTQTLTIDLGYVVQGNRAEELPERMALGLRLHGLDPLTAGLLPEFEDEDEDVPDLGDDTGYDTE